MRKIFTIRNIDAQREHMWNARRIEEEVAACPRRRIARYFTEYLPNNERILEAGCGLGAWVIYLGDLGYDVAGIDNDARVIARLKEWRPSLNVSAGDIRRLPYEEDSLGAVISLGVMEHFEAGCDEALRETWRVLRSGGLFFFTVPLNNLFRRLFAHPLRSVYLASRRRMGDSIHFGEYRFSRAEAEALLRRTGFDPFVTTWDDFLPIDMSLGIWTDFPPLQSAELFRMTFPGRLTAIFLNSVSRWAASGGVLCIAKKVDR